MKLLKKVIFNILFRLDRNITNKVLYTMLPIEFLRRKGARIGKGCRIYTKFCCTEPYLLSIGNNVSIGVGVELLTHDGAIWVLRHIRKNPNLDWFAPIEIGDNVFIGNGVKILPGVTIGTNVIIGANSVVTKSLSSNKIYAGTPAQEVSNIESYCNKKIIGCVETKTMSQREKQIYLSNKSPS